MRTAHGWHGSFLRPMDRPAWLLLGRICQMSVCYPEKGDFGRSLGSKRWLGQCVPWTSDDDCPGDTQVRPWCRIPLSYKVSVVSTRYLSRLSSIGKRADYYACPAYYYIISDWGYYLFLLSFSSILGVRLTRTHSCKSISLSLLSPLF
jgi:hypothetical protein